MKKILIVNLPGMPLSDSYLREIGMYQFINYLEDNSKISFEYLDLNSYFLPSYKDIDDYYKEKLLSDGRFLSDNLQDILNKILKKDNIDFVILNIFRTSQFSFFDEVLKFIQGIGLKVILAGRISQYGSFMTPNMKILIDQYTDIHFITSLNSEKEVIIYLNENYNLNISIFNSIFDLKINKKYKFDNNIYLTFELSRGCINNCFYCANSLGKLQTKSANESFSELLFLINFTGIKKIIFVHSQINDSFRKGELKIFLNKIIEHNIDIRWTSYLIPNSELTEEIYKLMSKSGCSLLSMGVESFLGKHLELIGKANINSILNNLERSYKFSIKSLVHIIYGFPNETLNDVKINIKRIIALRKFIYCINLSFLEIPYNKTILNKKIIDPNFKDIDNYISLLDGYSKQLVFLNTYDFMLSKYNISLTKESDSFNHGIFDYYLKSM